jgi:hypothetical protein
LGDQILHHIAIVIPCSHMQPRDIPLDSAIHRLFEFLNEVFDDLEVAVVDGCEEWGVLLAVL